MHKMGSMLFDPENLMVRQTGLICFTNVMYLRQAGLTLYLYQDFHTSQARPCIGFTCIFGWSCSVLNLAGQGLRSLTQVINTPFNVKSISTGSPNGQHVQ
jgi:hypothetical protein